MKHYIQAENPHPQSFAASVIMKRVYRERELEDYLEFREQFLNSELDKNGMLQCSYCSRADLKISVGENPTKSELEHLATLDHDPPLSNGGEKLNPNHVLVACYNCNQRRGNMPSEKFREKMRKH